MQKQHVADSIEKQKLEKEIRMSAIADSVRLKKILAQLDSITIKESDISSKKMQS
ncbi:MAG: hypothetical protein QM764_06815 [Chitinophagaceae bacterium]